MATGNVLARIEGSALVMTWDLFDTVHAVAVQVAMDPEFTKFLNTFIIPPVTGATFDVGGGHWYFRVGAFVGTKTEGKIQYGAIYGPAVIPHAKPPQKMADPALKVLHTRPILEGVRFHVDRVMPTYTVLEYSKNSKFNASETTSLYLHDVGHGHFDIQGLDSAHTYSARLTTWDGDLSDFPKDRIARFTKYQAVHNVHPSKPGKKADASLRTATVSAAPLLHEARHKVSMKFASHSDYLRYLAAKTEAERS
jgi:hypothetical protein